MTTEEGILAEDPDATCTNMKMQKMRKAEPSEGSPKNNHKRWPSKAKEKKMKKHKIQVSEHGSEDETGCEAEPSGKKEMLKKEKVKWSESLDEKNHKRGLDSGKAKKYKQDQIDELVPEEKTGCKAEPCVKKNEEGEEEKIVGDEKSKPNEDFSQEDEEAVPYRIDDEKKGKRTKSDDCVFVEDNVHKECSHINKEEEKRRKSSKSEKHGGEKEDFSERPCIHINKKKMKKTKLDGRVSEENVDGDPGCRENVEMACLSERTSLRGSSMKASFSDDVEICPLANGESSGETDQGEGNGQSSGKTNRGDGLIRGKRFSREEDEMVRKAVLDYIKIHELGDEGLNKVLHCSAFPEVKNCWKDIGAALPWRPYMSIYYRAHILFERGEKRKWTPEEYELVRKFHEKHGSEWKVLADALGKHRFHVKDTWRRIKLPNRKKGHWSQDEYQKLFDLVNTDLRLKAFEEKKSKHGMLRDNIPWGAISDKLSTRSTALCCQKWYYQLTSPMVAEGEWADVDDYRLLDALSSLDACSMEDVEWDHLLEHRDGDACRKRWIQMVKHIGGNNSFAEQVEVLSKRYCRDVLAARETYDNRPVVD